MKAGIGKGEGEIVWMGGVGVVYKIPASATGGAFSLIEHVVKPGAMTPPHRHTREHEFSYVLEGVLGAEIGGTIVHAQPGEFALKPKGIPHTFWNEGPDVLRFLEIFSPAGFEQFFAEGSKLIPANGPPDEAKLMALSKKYGVENDMDRAPELMKRFGVRILG
jgi:mannose-6-phosphate isomerase-like protein (cupin superfamily)